MNISPEEIDALRTLIRVWSIDRFVVIGASALRCSLGLRWRVTYDLDAALAVSLARYPAGLDEVPGWSRHPQREQTWIGPGDVQVDVIPIGEAGDAEHSLTWPATGFEMTLTGLHLAFEQATTITIAPRLSIRVAPPEIVALLKMVSYLDRPYERERDLQDIAWVLTDFIADTDNRRFTDEILDLEIPFDEVSPYLLGKRLSSLVSARERKLVLRFIDLVKRDEDPAATQARMIVNSPPSWHRDVRELLSRVAAFEWGFSVTFPSPRSSPEAP